MTLAAFLAQIPTAIDAKADAHVDILALATSSMDALVAAAPGVRVSQYMAAREQIQLAGTQPVAANPHTQRGVIGRALRIACISCVAAQALTDQAVADLISPLWA